MSDRLTAAPLRPASVPGRLLQDYRVLPGLYDEMCGGEGALRPHCEYVMRSFDALDAEEVERRAGELRRLLYENGVTYNVYDDARKGMRPWPLDPIPLLLTSSEWSSIEQGLIQRAEVLDLLLADIYGPRTLLRAGVLPAELIHAHSGFLRPCDAVTGLGEHRLLLYAADLARTPEGQMMVIGERTQAPSGAGYALENRTVLSRVFPSLYRDAHVHRLALFFRGVRAALNSLAPQRDNPRVVLLTPGPDNETYFEHAYLATYLGYTLVQGNDLVVRDDRVWLKTLDGMTPVDVILRRVDDAYCDPLELRAESLLGTAGLLQACRLGQVAIANPLGSGILENAGLMAFLPALARELLGEELKLPSVATWWCGRPDARAYVLEHLDRLVVKPILPHRSASTVFGSKLSTQERWALAETIRARPHLFVGQEEVALSTAPVITEGRIEPRPMVLRSFLVAGPEGYLVMPGGLGRVSPSPDTWLVSNQHGGVSKDVWVLASEPERQVSLLPSPSQPLQVTREGDDVSARVADNLFWLGRYVERTEATAQLLREVVLRLLGSEPAQADDGLAALLGVVTVVTATYPGFIGDGAAARLRAPEQEVLSVLLDERRAGTLRYNLDGVVRTGRSVRDRLTSDTLRVINALHRELSRPFDLNGALKMLERVTIQLAAFAGLCNESMSRGLGWRLLQIGRCLERGVQTLNLVQAIAPAAAGNNGLWEAVLAVAHSAKTYRRRYRSHMQARAVLDLLLLDESNPRSVGYQLNRLHALVGALGDERAPRRSAAERMALDALNRLRLFDVDGVHLAPNGDAAPSADSLAELLAALTALLAQLSDELTRQYFTQAEPPQQLIRLV
ncbi:MAG: circularly permuted type 2 ATP-grasp protein [Candidatus Binatia bacterium]